MEIDSSFERFIKDRQAQQVSPRYIEQVKHKFKLLGVFLRGRGVKDVAGLNSDLLVDFMLEYIQPKSGRKYSPWYIRGIANTVRAYLNFLVEMRYIRKEIHFPIPRFHRPLPTMVDVDQMQKIIDACSDIQKKLLMAFFFDSGLRLAEVTALIWDDLSFEKGTILVRHGKGDKFRYVPLGKTVIRLLARYRAEFEAATGSEPLPGEPIFISSLGTAYTLRGMNSVFVRLSKRVGFRVTAHMLRRGCAKVSRKLGRDWEDIQQAFGHASMNQTRMYVGYLSQEDIQKARPTSPVDRTLRIIPSKKGGARKK